MTAPAPLDARATRRGVPRAGLLLGLGLVAGLDQVVFHQLLGWHTLYDLSTPLASRLWEGVLHSASLVLVVGAATWGLLLSRRPGWSWRRWWAGVLVGGGAFQLFDGVVHHKVLGLHQVRYGVDLLPYDLAWDLAGVALLLAGVLLWRTGGPTARPRPTSQATSQ
ncbi:DUF2243 domain-containing protein [Aquipuribacter sp. SD81]|uniref:DUF2243 domain-containing protein n=1 Tax=Aquipuribacter sp. SD81 TaxID=3127703 RepID=UPI003016D274